MTPPAVWIGGPQGSGKTSIAHALSRRHDLQLYPVDARTWNHLERRPPETFMARTLDERWVEPTPAVMLEWFVQMARDRVALIVEDLAALPSAPLVVVEDRSSSRRSWRRCFARATRRCSCSRRSQTSGRACWSAAG